MSKTKDLINAKIAERGGPRVRDSIKFEAEYILEITEELAAKAQAELGYDARGYGFDRFNVTRDPVTLRYKATWECSGSCD